MALAGLIERRAGNDAETAVVTMDSSKGELAWLHDRQPLVLVDDDDFEAWMRDETWATLAEQRKGRDPKMKGVLKWHPVTTRMNVGELSKRRRRAAGEARVREERRKHRGFVRLRRERDETEASEDGSVNRRRDEERRTKTTRRETNDQSLHRIEHTVGR